MYILSVILIKCGRELPELQVLEALPFIIDMIPF